MTINRREFIEGARLVAGGIAVTDALEALPVDSAQGWIGVLGSQKDVAERVQKELDLHQCEGEAGPRVDPDLGLVRLNRFVGAYDAGRIINPKTARSQAIGGIIWGVGQALLEKSETDPTMGRFMNRNYSGYLVPTNADIPDLDILFVGEFDEEASPLGKMGLGELTAVSVAPAIANAVLSRDWQEGARLADHGGETAVNRSVEVIACGHLRKAPVTTLSITAHRRIMGGWLPLAVLSPPGGRRRRGRYVEDVTVQSTNVSARIFLPQPACRRPLERLRVALVE